MTNQKSYSKIYPQLGKDRFPSNTNTISTKDKATQLKNQLRKYALYSTALLGTAALQEVSTAEAAIVHNFGSFTGTSDPIGGSVAPLAQFNVSTSAQVSFTNGTLGGNKLYGYLGINKVRFVVSGNYLQRLSTADIVNGSGADDSVVFANTSCTNDGATGWLSNPNGYIGFTMQDGKNGWMRVSFDCGNQTIVHEFAYEDTPGVAIRVGDTGKVDVPTLSEWSLINLALLLLTFGTIYLIDPNFSLRKKNS